MKNKELFDKSIGVLVNAYNSGTLEYGQCTSCAVGHLISAANGYVNDCLRQWINSDGDRVAATWFCAQHFPLSLCNMDDTGTKQLESTGYSLKELGMIESAFESTDEDDESLYDGLMNVMETLFDIHEVENRDETREQIILNLS